MATINSREVVDRIIEGNGFYPGDRIRVVRIVEYTSNWNTTCYGLTYEGEPLDNYLHNSPFTRNPKIIWEVGQ